MSGTLILCCSPQLLTPWPCAAANAGSTAFVPVSSLVQHLNHECCGVEACKPPLQMAVSGATRRAAVVGAGAAGLAAAKQLRENGHAVRVFEMSNDVGGVWQYEEKVEADLMGTEIDKRIHSSMYESLRTNLPREVMAFDSLPFTDEYDARRFPHHSAVHKYLRKYAETHDLRTLISFGRKVTNLEPLQQSASVDDSTHTTVPANHESRGGEGAGDVRGFQGIAWAVEHSPISGGEVLREEFDVVMVCNGHYSEPWSPSFEGADTWPGRFSHSHNYRTPAPFTGQRVVVIGASASGEDISRDISSVASAVYLSARSWQNAEWGSPDAKFFGPRADIIRKRPIRRLLADGAVEFDDGSVVKHVDHLLFCTGYRYRFPFLESTSVVRVQDNAVLALYKHMLPPDFPGIAFIGLPSKVIPFPQFEAQTRYVSALWAGNITLPPASVMHREIEEELAGKLRAGVPQKYFHVQGGAMFAYNDELNAASAGPVTPLWRILMHNQCSRNKRTHPEDYRDIPLPTVQEYQAHIAHSQGQSMEIDAIEISRE